MFPNAPDLQKADLLKSYFLWLPTDVKLFHFVFFFILQKFIFQVVTDVCLAQGFTSVNTFLTCYGVNIDHQSCSEELPVSEPFC